VIRAQLECAELCSIDSWSVTNWASSSEAVIGARAAPSSASKSNDNTPSLRSANAQRQADA
jgi:hypothetical protein